MQLVNCDGGSFWVPVEKEKIGSERNWERAFRIYAVIFSKANPTRAHEIWQYIHVITTAASSFIWENVSEYDVTFKQLMANFPQCSWGKIYTQMWNLAMHDPIQKNNRAGASQNKGSGNSEGKNRDRYCWKFNKNRCKSKSCDWEHRCKYCDVGDMVCSTVTRNWLQKM